jgi:hypothetical protein
MRLGLANSLEPEAGDGPPRAEEAAVVVLVVDEGDVEAPHVQGLASFRNGFTWPCAG